MFESEFQYFVQHQEELVARYRGKVLVLHGAQVVGVHDTALQAYTAALEQFPPGTFMLQLCAPGPAAYTVTIAPGSGTL